MASGGVAADKPQCDAMLVDKLPEEINEMKIEDEKVEKVCFLMLDALVLMFILVVILVLVAGNGSCCSRWKWN